jgi:hypothetical protein
MNPDPAFQVNPDMDIGIQEKIQLKKLFIFFHQKLQLTYPSASMKNIQARENPSALKRKHPALGKMKYINFFVGHFCPPGS